MEGFGGDQACECDCGATEAEGYAWTDDRGECARCEVERVLEHHPRAFLLVKSICDDAWTWDGDEKLQNDSSEEDSTSSSGAAPSVDWCSTESLAAYLVGQRDAWQHSQAAWDMQLAVWRAVVGEQDDLDDPQIALAFIDSIRALPEE